MIFHRKNGHRLVRPGALPVRGEVAEGGVEPLAIIISFDVGEQVPLGGFTGRVGSVMDELGLQGMEPAFHGCVVPAIALSAHRRNVPFAFSGSRSSPAAYWAGSSGCRNTECVHSWR